MLKKTKYVFAVLLLLGVASCEKDLGECECEQEVGYQKSSNGALLNEDCTDIVDPGDEENENPNKTGNSRSPGVRGDGPTSIGNVVDPGDDDSESGQGGKKRIKKFNIRP